MLLEAMYSFTCLDRWTLHESQTISFCCPLQSTLGNVFSIQDTRSSLLIQALGWFTIQTPCFLWTVVWAPFLMMNGVSFSPLALTARTTVILMEAKPVVFNKTCLELVLSIVVLLGSSRYTAVSSIKTVLCGSMCDLFNYRNFIYSKALFSRTSSGKLQRLVTLLKLNLCRSMNFVTQPSDALNSSSEMSSLLASARAIWLTVSLVTLSLFCLRFSMISSISSSNSSSTADLPPPTERLRFESVSKTLMMASRFVHHVRTVPGGSLNRLAALVGTPWPSVRIQSITSFFCWNVKDARFDIAPSEIVNRRNAVENGN